MAVFATPHLRLHLGCGSSRIAGWVNIDNEADLAPDLVADVRQLPYEDDSVEQIAAFHVLEHFRYDEPVLEEWHRVLVPGGECTVVVPDPMGAYLLWRRGGVFGQPQQYPIDLDYMMAVFFGGPALAHKFHGFDADEQAHRQVFLFDMLVERMRPLFPDAAQAPGGGPATQCGMASICVVGHKAGV